MLQVFTQLAFYVSTVASTISIGMAAISFMTKDMYEVNVRAAWENGLSDAMEGFSMQEAMDRVSSSVGSLGDSATGLLTVLGTGLYASMQEMGGVNWLVTNLVDMEKFIVAGSGFGLIGMSGKLGMDYPPGNIIFVPLSIVGVLVSGLGILKAIPMLETKYPDVMLKLHKLQLVVCGGLGGSALMFTRAARNVAPFIQDNWFIPTRVVCYHVLSGFAPLPLLTAPGSAFSALRCLAQGPLSNFQRHKNR